MTMGPGGVANYTCCRWITPGQARLLAILLLADGRRVHPVDAFRLLGRPLEQAGKDLRRTVRAMERRGVRCVGTGRDGARLTGLPPDWALEQVLHEARRFRREWAWRMSRHRRIA